MTSRGKWARAASAVALAATAALAAGCSSASSGSGNASLEASLPTNFGAPEKTELNVAVVPAMDSAGFFIAMHDGLFAKEGLTIKYTPAISSETAVAEQLKGQLDISGGNYVSYINEAALNHQPIEVVAEGSIMQQGAQTIFTMPDSKIKTIGQLKGHLVGVNAPGNIDYLLGVSVLSENGVDPKSVNFPNATMKAFSATGGAIPFPFMAGDLASGKISAAIMPEPFASQAEQEYGAVPLADLNQGATSDFPIEGYVATKAWAAKYPNTLKRFLAALETGQEIADTDRSAVETAFESIDKPQDGQVTKGIGAVMALDTYPIGVDATRLQRVANVMFQFNLLPSTFNVSNMLLPKSFFNFSQFSSAAS
ncbi:ABC transporter substrate-binding protein [Trebonia kvetii]|uniref:ABC transporter substrate-binding protein n=1 Tax=Trebonia kvetii TaxID=2480626 RepID=A0A6P2C1E5_9ACTN|nr:ABC transporter substrate-binding protein [Trebonia kvetii]TVZ04296.1 ABC transporter substrate-binding protein [Trebonia kvetii]